MTVETFSLLSFLLSSLLSSLLYSLLSGGNMGVVGSVLFFILGIQTGLTNMEPQDRLQRLFKNFCLLIVALLHYVHTLVHPQLESLSLPASRYARYASVTLLHACTSAIGVLVAAGFSLRQVCICCFAALSPRLCIRNWSLCRCQLLAMPGMHLSIYCTLVHPQLESLSLPASRYARYASVALLHCPRL